MGSLDEADQGHRPYRFGFLERAGQPRCDRAGDRLRTNLPTDAQVPELDERFTRAMDDDLGTPASRSRHALQRRSTRATRPCRSPILTPPAVAAHLGQLKASCSRVLGLDPQDDPVWASSRSHAVDDKLEPVVDGLGPGHAGPNAAEARARKDWATADSIRDVLTHLGLVIEDTPDGARWIAGLRWPRGRRLLKRPGTELIRPRAESPLGRFRARGKAVMGLMASQLIERTTMAGNSQRRAQGQEFGCWLWRTRPQGSQRPRPHPQGGGTAFTTRRIRPSRRGWPAPRPANRRSPKGQARSGSSVAILYSRPFTSAFQYALLTSPKELSMTRG